MNTENQLVETDKANRADHQDSADLRCIKVGQRAVVSAVTGCSKTLLHKLLSMGLVQGAEVRVTQRGLFGSPINIHLLGSVLSLRSAEAAHVQVRPL